MTTIHYVVQELPWGAYLEFNRGIPPARHTEHDEATRFTMVRPAHEAATAEGLTRFTVVAVEGKE